MSSHSMYDYALLPHPGCLCITCDMARLGLFPVPLYGSTGSLAGVTYHPLTTRPQPSTDILIF